jgi:RNA polymerase sigma factor (sigma-70 family)
VQCRSGNRRPRHDTQRRTPYRNLGSTDVVPEATHHDGTDRIVLLEDLRRLSPRQRAVIVLRYFDDLTEADTAAALGISVGTVKSQVRDALTRLLNQQSGEEQSAATT